MIKIKQYRGVFLGLPTYNNFKCSPFNRSLIKANVLLKKRGYRVGGLSIIGVPYVQQARNMIAKAFLESNYNVLLFLDDDLSWDANDVIRLLETPGRVVAGTYLKKQDKIDYVVMPQVGNHNIPLTRTDGCIAADRVATGFLKIERQVFTAIKKAYPKLVYGKGFFDFFPQGVYNHRWIGEDYAFCRLWTKLGGKVWILPDIDFIHYALNKEYPGNYHEYLMRLPGGCKEGK